MIGDIRGQGLIWCLEIVEDKISKTPAPDLCLNVMYGLKTKKIVVGITGRHKNIVVFTPPMCFTVSNSRRFCEALDDVLAECAASFTLQSINLNSKLTSSTNDLEDGNDETESLTNQSAGNRKRSHVTPQTQSSLDDGEESYEDTPEEDDEDEEAAKRAKLEYSQLD